MTQRPVYLDHHATTPVDPRVFEAMRPFFTEQFGNAASVNHAFGWDASAAVESARQQAADLLGVRARSIIFASGATEANNLAIKGVMQAAGENAHFITTAAEHRAVLDPAKSLRRAGFDVTILPVQEDGSVDPDAVSRAITEKTVLVSVMTANNEVGTLSDVEAVGSICRDRDVLFHTDAVQAIGKVPLDLSSLPVDLASVTAHKLYGPKGIGALYVNRGGKRIPIAPQIEGGGHEHRLRSGTLPVPLVVGFGAACEFAGMERDTEGVRLASLCDRLWTGLQDELDGLVLNGHPTQRLPGNLNFSVHDVDGEALMTSLTTIAVSSGSACTSADPEPSHVLRAMGRSDALTRGSLRFGIGRFNTQADIDIAIEAVADAVRRLRTSTRQSG